MQASAGEVKPSVAITAAVLIMVAAAWLTVSTAMPPQLPKPDDKMLRSWPSVDACGICYCTHNPWMGGVKKFSLTEGNNGSGPLAQLAFAKEHDYETAEKLTGHPVFVRGIIATRGEPLGGERWLIVESITACK